MKKIIIALLFIVISGSCYVICQRQGVSQRDAHNDEKMSISLDESVPLKSLKKLPSLIYKPEKFYVASTIKGLSTNQITEHEGLYQKYVAKRNEIAKKLDEINRSMPESVTYSEFRELKVEETFARNADILHKLYFQNLEAGRNTKVGPETERIIIENFGSLEAFKADLFATARSARGWALTCYDIDSGRVHNFLLDSHNNLVPIMAIPLLVLDVYEHAYWLDYGDQRVTYLDVFWRNINWKVVEERITRYIKPLLDAKKAQDEKVGK